MLEITSHRNGEVLNHTHGRETAEALTIVVRGIADPQSLVTVNGLPTFRHDRQFFVEVPLRERINRVTACAHDKFGERTQTIVLVWDKASFKRYTVRIDDNSFFFTDLVLASISSATGMTLASKDSPSSTLAASGWLILRTESAWNAS